MLNWMDSLKGRSMMRLASGALVAAAGCVSVAVDSGAVATPEKKGPAQPLAKVRIDSARNTKYGVWVGKGPRILDADGNPLLDAQVHFRDDPEMFRFGLDEDARVVVNRYLDTYNHSANVNVTCPGYRSRRDVPLFQGEKLVDEIRLEKSVDQPPCRGFNAATDIFGDSKERVYGFDLVEGDWMPPRGWGKTEDIRVHLAADPSALPSETSSHFSISSSGIKPRRSGGSNWEEFVKIEFLGKDDGYGYDRRAFADSTNRVLTATAYGSLPNVGYRVRGYYGELTGFSMRKKHDYDAERGKAVPRKPGVLDCLHVEISGRVNREPGLKALVPASAAVVPRSPTFHPVPGNGNALAFGLSADERAAVCFGWTQDGAKVPEIFEKGVYTADPATALPRLVTLYFDPSYRGGANSPMINGLPELRTVVNICDVYGQGIGESAFANNPKLNAVVFTDGYEMTVAGNAFSGCATNVTAVFVEGGREFPRAWQSIAVSNVFARMCKVVTGGRQQRDTLARPEIDTRFGIVELPVLTMDEDRLEKEYSDGRIIRYFKDGTVEKLRK